ncbi:hypothetical protein [Acidovorax sp. NCPPB 4044]|uniref:hypothetical protein n=1 Tax=Acidovorax sp. NCPPB 4044 TaxID=2940490 RepID=UPI002304B02F|nr:hypothetical protein [Acidovorax sp. NCPPB 4044]MDA8521985.1 hypothetical protein [Acidovorax sp. NCPPB 4044]
MKAIKEFQGVPNGEIYPVTYVPGDEVPPELHATARHFGALGSGGAPVLRDDGPTVAQYVAAGYGAESYPPAGYASRSTEDEIAAAEKAQATPLDGQSATDDAAKQTIPEIKAKLDELKIEHKSGMSKADLLALLPKD